MTRRPSTEATEQRPATRIRHRANDAIRPFDIIAEVLEDGIENGEIVRFEDGDHGLFYEEREKLNDELVDFAR